MTVAVYNPDNERLFKEDTEAKLVKALGKIGVNSNNGQYLAAKVGLHEELPKKSSLDMRTLRDVRALVQALGTNTEKLGNQKLFLDKRTYGEVKTMAEMLRVNADKLDNLTKEMDFLVDSEKVDKTANLSSEIIERLDRMNSDLMTRLDNMNPLFISMFVMLADISFATSLRLAHHEEDMRTMWRYFRSDISPDRDRLALDTKLLPVFEWYTGSGIHYTACVDYRNAGFKNSGGYTIIIHNTKQLRVYCDQDTDGGGWLVIQRRQDGSVDFYRDWFDYQEGFGDISGEFWLGNDNINLLTRKKQELRVDLIDFEGNTTYAKYSSFAVGSTSENYKLTIGGYSGTAGDAMPTHNGMEFSTRDRDNDRYSGSCAVLYKGSWWYNHCYTANLNGIFYNNATHDNTGIRWQQFKGPESLKAVEMKVRPRE